MNKNTLEITRAFLQNTIKNLEFQLEDTKRGLQLVEKQLEETKIVKFSVGDVFCFPLGTKFMIMKANYDSDFFQLIFSDNSLNSTPNSEKEILQFLNINECEFMENASDKLDRLIK